MSCGRVFCGCACFPPFFFDVGLCLATASCSCVAFFRFGRIPVGGGGSTHWLHDRGILDLQDTLSWLALEGSQNVLGFITML